MCRIPAELQSFYQTTDGILIQWSVNFHGNFNNVAITVNSWYCKVLLVHDFFNWKSLLLGGILQLGQMEVNPIASLTKLAYSKPRTPDDEPSLVDIDSESDELDEQGNTKLKMASLVK